MKLVRVKANKLRDGFALLCELPSLLNDRQHLVFQKWAERYGDRFHIRIGNQRFVFFADPAAIRVCFDLRENELDAGAARRRL